MNNQDTEVLMGADAIATAMGIPRRKVYAMIQSRTIPTIKIGGTVALRKAKLAEWLMALEAA
ncbi:helix-turn-helix domain-containing protein [Rhizobium sp. RCAM05350]|nr:helix-turn-helix domain-containing protein [Rhizobium sp. RCAM05350]